MHHGAKIEDLEITAEHVAWSEAQDADIVLVSSGGDMSFMGGYSGKCFESPRIREKLVFLDGHDSNHYLVSPTKVKLYLKRELRYPEANCIGWGNVRSFLFGVYDFHFDAKQPLFSERRVDISFVAFGGSSPLRAEAARILNERHQNGEFIARVHVSNDSQPLPIDEYRSLMRNSKVIVSVPGAGLDTLRFWEAMGFGAVLCSVDIPHALVVRNAPEPHRHCLYFDAWQRMVELAKLVVWDADRWSKMRSASDTLIRCHHSTIRRAEQLIELFTEMD